MIRSCSEQPPTQQQTDDQAFEPDQSCHLIVAQAKLFLNPVKCLFVCEEDGTDRADNPFHRQIRFPSILIAVIDVRQVMVVRRDSPADCEA